MKLTDLKIRKERPAERVKKLSDGRGLVLMIKPNGAKHWKLRVRKDGRDTDVALGEYPTVGLAEAREKAQAARDTIAEGKNPTVERRREQTRAKVISGTTFKELTQAYLDTKTRWCAGHKNRFTNRMTKDVWPAIGQMPIDQIEAIDVLTAVKPIADRGAIDTAKRVTAMIGQVLTFSIALGLRRTNPATGMTAALPDTPPEQHRPALTEPDALRPFLTKLWGWNTPTISKPLMQMCLLTFQRPGEVRRMRWDQIGWTTHEWVFDVTKVGLIDHIVPLSAQSLTLLADLRQRNRDSDWVFATLGGRPPADVATSQFIDRLGFKGKMTAHGARAIARTTLVERMGFDEATVEMQLSHQPRDLHGRAYNRTQWRTERQRMMQAWADWLDQVRVVEPLPIAAE